MGKERLSITVDEEVAEEVKNREEINVSGLCNQYLSDYVTSGESERAVLEARVDRLEEDVSDTRETLERKERRLKRAKEQLEAFDKRAEDDLERELGRVQSIPSDPTHPEIQRIATDYDHSATEVAEKHAELNNKQPMEGETTEFKGYND